jgi:ankyrin repeat protein
MADVEGFFEAVRTGDLPRVELLLQDHALADAETPDRVSVLLLACYHAHPAVAAAIASRRPLITMAEAAALGDADRVRLLADRAQSSVNQRSRDGRTPLDLAAHFGHLTVLELLLARGADPNQPSADPMRGTPLHAAVAFRQPGTALTMVRLLLDHDADPNRRRHGGWTALHSAATHGNRELAAALVAHGAEREPRNDAGRTPADLARELGFSTVAEWLER